MCRIREQSGRACTTEAAASAATSGGHAPRTGDDPGIHHGHHGHGQHGSDGLPRYAATGLGRLGRPGRTQGAGASASPYDLHIVYTRPPSVRCVFEWLLPNMSVTLIGARGGNA